MKNTILIAAAALLLIAGTATAGGYCGHHSGMMFSKNVDAMDADNDGTVTFDEFNASMADRNQVVFDALDRNDDGRIDTAEWNEFLRVHGVAVEG